MGAWANAALPRGRSPVGEPGAHRFALEFRRPLVEFYRLLGVLVRASVCHFFSIVLVDAANFYMLYMTYCYLYSSTMKSLHLEPWLGKAANIIDKDIIYDEIFELS